MIFNRHPQGLFSTLGQSKPVSNSHWVIVGRCESPTTDFYFRSRRGLLSGYDELDTGNVSLLSQLSSFIPQGAQIVLVRDVPVEWLVQLLKVKHRLSAVVWFMDDDIPGVVKDKTLPPAYRKRLSRWYRKAFPLLESLCDQVWVSTPHLAELYNLPANCVLPPIEPEKTVSNKLVRCFYHGSGSHTQEWDFLYHVISQVQAQNENTWFELIGDHALYKRFKGVPRVTVLHPMPWQDYFTMTSHRTMDIGLAPLLDTPFNRARSHTKFLDITRQGAVGVYSQRFSRAGEIEASGAGVVVSSDGVDVWVVALETLLKTSRRPMFERAQRLSAIWRTEEGGFSVFGRK